MIFSNSTGRLAVAPGGRKFVASGGATTKSLPNPTRETLGRLEVTLGQRAD